MAMRIDHLKRRFKSIAGVANFWLTTRWPDDRDDIKSPRRLRRAVAAHVKFRGFGDLMTLDRVDLIFRHRIIVHARFHFDENNCFAIPRNNIDLADVAAKIAKENFVAEVAQKFGGDVFAALAENVGGVFAFEKRL